MIISDIQRNLVLKPQECKGNYTFSGKAYLTSGFLADFGEVGHLIAIAALLKIRQDRVYTPAGADYLQVVEFKGLRFYAIDDVTHVTFLLPNEY